MPPRLRLLQFHCPGRLQASPILRLLAPISLLPQQCRSASILSSLSDNRSAYNKRIRRGRGPASGKGKTSGRGHKGQKQHGKVPRGFNGGQTPIEVVKGKRGFENQFSVEMSPLNVDRLQDWIDQGRLDITKPITMKELNDSRCLHGVKDGVKLLGRGAEKLRSPVNIIVSRASAAAIAAVEGAGGKITTRYYAPQTIRRVLRGMTDPLSFLGRSRTQLAASETDETAATRTSQAPAQLYPFKLSNPTGRKDIEYYRDPAHRGYMRHKIKTDESPSLFFRTPGYGRKTKQKDTIESKSSSTLTLKGAENKLW